MLPKESLRRALFDTSCRVKRLIDAIRRKFEHGDFTYITALRAYEEWLQQNWILPSTLGFVSVCQGR
jgi:hypothetical protein